MEFFADDRVSGLPESILHHILSFLHIEDAVQTAVISRRLNQVWSTLPYLDLGPNFFPILRDKVECAEEEEEEEEEEGEGEGEGEEVEEGEGEGEGEGEEDGSGPVTETDEEFSEDDEDDEESSDSDDSVELDESQIRRRREKFIFMEQTLTSRRLEGLTIQKFRLGRTKLDVELRQSLSRWIHYLVECGIKELVLHISFADQYYNLPPILLTASSLRSLTLNRCRMPCGAISLASLRHLKLEWVCIDDQFLIDVISTCRELEELVVDLCSGLKRKTIEISGQSQLMKVLKFTPHDEDEIDEVVVQAQYLEKFSWVGGVRPMKLDIVTNFKGSLKCLLLYGNGTTITNKWFGEVICKLGQLEELSLGALKLDSIEITSSSLKRLILFQVFEHNGTGFGEFTIDAPNMVYLSYTGSLKSVFVNKVAAKEVVLAIEEVRRKCAPEELCHKLIQFLHKFDYSEVLTLDCENFEQIIFPVQTRLNLFAPLVYVKHLILRGRLKASPNSVVLPALLDSVRWIAPRLVMLSFKDNYFKEGNLINISTKFPSDMKFKLEGHHDAELSRCFRHFFTHHASLVEEVDC